MAFEFEPQPGRLLALVRGASTDPRDAAFVEACDAARHRRHFFADTGSRLARRGQTIFKVIDQGGLLPANGKPGKPQITSFCEQRPVSLNGLAKIDRGLVAIAASKDPLLLAATQVGQDPFVLSDDSIVPSIYHADPDDLMGLRTSTALGSRETVSTKIFGPGKWDTLRILERGEGGQHARVTKATVDLIAQVLGPDVYDIFTFDADAGPKNGDHTFALPLNKGNLLAPLPQPAARQQAG